MRIPSFLRLSEKPAPKPDTQERGSSGMAYRVGTSGLARLTNLGEYNASLRGITGYRTYDRMRLSDPKVSGLRRAQNLPLLSAGVTMEPADPKDPKAVEIADEAKRLLLSGDPAGIADPWAVNLRQFLLYLDYGHAPFEMCWALRDGRAVIDRFAYRPPKTIQEIDVQNGRIAKVLQVTDTGTNAEIPGEKLLWFCNEREGDDFTGRPLLRPMYKPWYNKERAEILLLILLEKMGGIPIAREVENGLADQEQRDNLDSALEALHMSERGFLRVPAGVEFQIESGNITLKDGLELVRYWDQQLSTVAQQQFLDLGQTPNGSRALSVNLSDMYLNALTSVAKSIEDTFSAPGGPLHQFVAYNWPNSDDLIPKLRFASLGKLDIKTLAEAMVALNGMGMEFGDETWEWIRSELDLPAHEASDETAPQAPKEKTPPAPPAANEDDDEDEPPAGGVEASEHLHLAGGKFRRALTPLESYVALDEIADALDDAKNVVRTRTQAIRDRMVADITARAMAAIESGDPAKVAALASAKVPSVDALAREVRAIFAEYFDSGRKQVADELTRQKAGEPVLDEVTGERRGESLAMASTIRPLTAKEARRFYELLDSYGEVAARNMASAAIHDTAKRAVAALSSPVSLEVLREMVTRTCDEAALEVGWTVTQVVIDGRSAEAIEERAHIARGVYSAILDGATCGTCEDREGDETTDLDEAAAWTPNPDCEGGERCRCMVIYEYKVGD